MSMLSSQCDELRDRAMRVEIFLEGSTDAIPTDTHEQLRSAADTIWELRCKLEGVVDQSEEIKRLEDENARLRSCLSDDAENARQIMAENAKLQELVKSMHGWLVVNYEKFYVIPLNGLNDIERDMRELGMEVPDV